MTCQNCGFDAAETSRFCPHCGMKMEPPAVSGPAPSEPEDGAPAVLGPLWSTQEDAFEPGSAAPPAETATAAAAAPPAAGYSAQAAPGVPPAFSFAHGSSQPRYAGFWRRTLAFLLDYFLVISSLYEILVVLGVAAPVPPPMSPDVVRMLKVQAVLLPLIFFYYVVLECSPLRATLGKRALDLAVTDREGHRLSLVRSVGRTLAKVLSTLPLFLGFLLAAFTARKQALHDLISGCVVVRRT